jgi:hypothetical protein
MIGISVGKPFGLRQLAQLTVVGHLTYVILGGLHRDTFLWGWRAFYCEVLPRYHKNVVDERKIMYQENQWVEIGNGVEGSES